MTSRTASCSVYYKSSGTLKYSIIEIKALVVWLVPTSGRNQDLVRDGVSFWIPTKRFDLKTLPLL